jgi:hypothetical protein
MAQIILDSNNNLIQGDFDNATLNNRTKLQTTTTNATTNVYVVPNGSSTSAGVSVANNSSLTNASKIVMATNGSTDVQIISGVNGSGTYLPLSFYTNNAFAMTVDTSQNVGIGTTSPTAKLNVATGSGTLTQNIVTIKGGGSSGSFSGLSVQSNSGDEIFNVNNLSYNVTMGTVAGSLLVGQTTNAQGGKLVVKGSGGSDDDLVFNSSSTYSEIQSFNSKPLILNRQGNEVWIGGTTDRGAYNLQCNGTGVWGAGAYVNGSDARIKDDIKPIASSLEVVNKLNPVTFKYKEDWSTDQSVQTGFIAQELQETLKDEIYIDGLVSTGGEYLSVAYQNIIPILTKAIQEQQTIINELKTRIEALENK